MEKLDFYTLTDQEKKIFLEAYLENKGTCIDIYSGMCGEIYIFDQGKHHTPRYICAKIPKPLGNSSLIDINYRFVNELRTQLSFYHHAFVHWVCDFSEVLGVPVALFNYWGNDLGKLVQAQNVSEIEKLAIMVYACSGLSHCYRKGLICHQDLKPANIFLKNAKKEFRGLPDLDIYNTALIADFGLANAFVTSSVFSGSRPYMAPEQWQKKDLSSKTDVFALGVILFELMTNGLHPVGIKLNDYWPEPRSDNNKKWTRPGPWEQWAKHAHINFEVAPSLESDVRELIQKMLLVDAAERPSINEIKLTILEIIKNKSSIVTALQQRGKILL